MDLSPEVLAWMSKLNNNKSLGPGTVVRAVDMVVPQRFTSGCLSLDVALGGGFPGNQWTEVIGPESSGKALSLDTPIPTPHGWTTMGKLQVGDEVFDERGRACLVTFTTDVQYGRSCYRVVFSHGGEIVADADHQWEVIHKNDGGGISSRVVTTRQMVESGLKAQKGRAWRYRVPSTEPVQYISGPALLVDPYVFGAWLGDGSSASGGFTSADQEIIDEISAAGYTVTARQSVKRPYAWGILGLQSKLRELGVLGNKHIPREYLQASVDARISLLQGLMDTDGSATMHGSCEFTSTNERLAHEVYELIVSLGFRPHFGEGRATLQGRYISQKYRIGFGAQDIPVFRMTRKRERLYNQTRHAYVRDVISVEPVDSVPVRCIQVDSPRHLYLAGEDMIPTHNSALTLKSVAANQRLRPDFTAFWLAAEHYDTDQATALGVDNERVIVAPTQKLELGLEFLDDALESQAFDCLVLDSFPALLPDLEAEKGMDEATVAVGAKVFNKFWRKAGASGRRNPDGSERAYFGIVVNQWRDKIGTFQKFGVPQTSPGGHGKDYAFYTRLKVARDEFIVEKRPGLPEPVVVGQKIAVKTIKNKSAAPQQTAKVDFYFRNAPFTGFRRGDYDIGKDYVAMGVLFGVIQKKGSWCHFAGEKWISEDAMAEALREDKGLQEKLAPEVLEVASDPRRADDIARETAEKPDSGTTRRKR